MKLTIQTIILLSGIALILTSCSTNKDLSSENMISAEEMKTAIKVKTEFDQSGSIEVTLINTSSDTISTKGMFLHVVQSSTDNAKSTYLTGKKGSTILPGKTQTVSINSTESIIANFKGEHGVYGTSITYLSDKPLPHEDTRVLFYIYSTYPKK